MTNLKELLVKQINEKDPNIDVSVGSNFRDIVVNPLSKILESYQMDHKKVLTNLSLKDPTLLSEEELDSIGANFLVDRKEGSYHTGAIKLYFEEAVSISLPRNTRFKDKATGYEFETSSSYTGTKVGMLSTLDNNGQYSTGEISVRGVLRSTQAVSKTGANLEPVGLLTPPPTKVKVTSDITGGSERESNSSYFTRIKNTVRTSSLASSEVIKDSVMAEDTNITFAKVVGAGDPFMKRDLVSYNSLTPNKVESFEYVMSGTDSGVYYKGHKAYSDSFKISSFSGEDPDVVWPTSPSEWSSEFTNTQYKGIFKLDDFLKAEQDQYNLITVPTWNQSRLNLFSHSDGGRLDNNMVWTDEIRLDGSAAILGKTPQSDEGKEARISEQELKQLEIDISDGLNNNEKKKLEDALNQIKEKRKPENYANLAPILHKSLDQHTGVSIETRIQTSDESENGEICYITVLKNDTIFMPHDGYGLAWRKQPEFLVRLNYDNYAGDTELRKKDILKFTDYFGVDPVAEGLVGGDVLRTGTGNDQYWMFNFYLVDNNALEEEVSMGTNKVWDNLNGINQYLQRSKYWIEKDTKYDFKLKIDNNLGTKIWTKPATESTYDLKIDKGVTYPNYVPAAGTKISTGNNQVDALDSTRGHFGISVGQTKGYEWSVDNLFIRSIVEIFPMHLFAFKIDTDKWSAVNASFSVDYWGVGYDPEKFTQDGSGHSRTQLVIWNPGTTSWEALGEHKATPNDSTQAKKISKELSALNSYMDNNDLIYVAASAANYGTNFSEDRDHDLESLYIQLSNPEAGQKHLGNAVDIYCHSPSNIVEKSFTAVISSGEIIINEPYIQDILEVREALSQVAFPSTDYSIFNTKPGESFSADNSYKIAFSDQSDGTEITIIYRAWEGASSVNAYLNAPENRYPATTLKEKIIPPTKVTINDLEYSGDLSVARAKEVLQDFINKIEDDYLDKSDLISVLTQNGATYVNLDMDIDLKAYKPDGSYSIIELKGNRYKIPSTTISRFFTTTDDLFGVVNV